MKRVRQQHIEVYDGDPRDKKKKKKSIRTINAKLLLKSDTLVIVVRVINIIHKRIFCSGFLKKKKKKNVQ